MEKLWKRVFPVMLQLACDVEQVDIECLFLIELKAKALF